MIYFTVLYAENCIPSYGNSIIVIFENAQLQLKWMNLMENQENNIDIQSCNCVLPERREYFSKFKKWLVNKRKTDRKKYMQKNDKVIE